MRKLALTPERKKERVREQTRKRVAEWRASHTEPITRKSLITELLRYLHVSEERYFLCVECGWLSGWESDEEIEKGLREKELPQCMTLEYLEQRVFQAREAHQRRMALFRKRREREPHNYIGFDYEAWRTGRWPPRG